MKLLIIIPGSIAVQRLPDLIKKINYKNIETKFLATRAGINLINSLNLQTPKNLKFIKDDDQFQNHNRMLHIEMTRNVDAVLVFPASANIIGKYANGIADDLASTTLLASNKQIFIAPAMNLEMWENTSNQINVNKLKNQGVNFIGPVYGNLACGEIGFGRVSDNIKIVEEICLYLSNKKLLSGLTGIITSGPTIEPIDSTRFISNYSSGKQGYALAKILAYSGAKIKLISGPTKLDKPNNVDLINVSSANEMNDATMDLLPADFAICAAAVADFRPLNFSFQKRKKLSYESLKLQINPDILLNISKNKRKRPNLVIGFSAETKNIKSNAKQKLKNKKCNWILANMISKNNTVFGSNDNSIHFFTKNSYEKWPKMSKIQVAKKLNNKIVNFFIKKSDKSNQNKTA